MRIKGYVMRKLSYPPFLWGVTLLCLFSCNGLVEKLNDQPELDDFLDEFQITEPCSLSRDVDESYKLRIEKDRGLLYLRNFANRGENLRISAQYSNGKILFNRRISNWGTVSGEMRLRPPLFNVIDIEYALDERNCTEKGVISR